MSAVRHRVPLGDVYARAYAEVAASGASRTRFSPRRLARLLATMVVGFGITVAIAVILPTFFGLHSFTVLSGSMEPAIGTGDVIVVRSIPPLDARIGDVVTFRSPDDSAKTITHRVVRMDASSGLVRFVTRGDANTGSERWTVASEGVIGRVEYRVPKLGYVTNWLGGKFGRLGFLVLPALLLGFLELRRIWRTDPSGQ